jgi:hypothetical protein
MKEPIIYFDEASELTEEQIKEITMPSLSEELREKIIDVLYSTEYFDASTPDKYEEVRRVSQQIESLFHQYGVSEIKKELKLLLEDFGIEDNTSPITKRISELTQSDSREGGEE